MANNGSVAPKERVNIVYKPATGDAREDVELPLKQLVLGDFTLRESDVLLEDRQQIGVDKDNFSEVLKAQRLTLELSVPDRLHTAPEVGVAGADNPPGTALLAAGRALAVSLKFSDLRDFEPDSLVEQVPELRQLIELREALKALKGPLGNLPAFRNRLAEVVRDEAARERLLLELDVAAGE
jgi:type VI secretion system protein ImpB